MNQCPPCSGNCNQGRACGARQHYAPAPRQGSGLIRGIVLAVAIGVGLAAYAVHGLSA